MNFLKKLKPRPAPTDSQGFQYTVEELVSMYKANCQLSATFGSMLNDEILNYKTSDTIFVLGSGPSINELSEKNLEEIGKHDSIGFNFWIAHSLIPSMYMFQLPSRNTAPFIDLFNDRHERYKNIPFIIRGSALANNRIDAESSTMRSLKGKKAFFLNEYPISSKCSINPRLLIDYAHILGLLDYGKIARLVPKWRGTLGLIISLAYQMGYKKIVLCGMDMLDNRHFWDAPEYRELNNQYGLPDVTTAFITEMTNLDRSTNTVPEYVYALREWMREKSGVEISVAHRQTVLYPRLPLFPFAG